jgi:hypothetical protein
MALSTYGELKTSIADWLNRRDLTAVIPDFIRLLEAQIERTLRVREMFATADLTIDTTLGTITLPNDFLQVREVRVSDSAGHVVPVSYAAPNEITNVLAAQQGATAAPRVYCPGKDTIEFAPLPNGTYTVSLQYVRQIPKLSDANTSNWLLESHPDIYLYGSLLQAAPYLKNDERVQLWSSALSSLLEEMRVADERALKAGTPLKMRFRPYG